MERISSLFQNAHFSEELRRGIVDQVKHRDISPREYLQEKVLDPDVEVEIELKDTVTNETITLPASRIVEEALDYRTFSCSKAQPYWKPNSVFLLK